MVRNATLSSSPGATGRRVRHHHHGHARAWSERGCRCFRDSDAEQRARASGCGALRGPADVVGIDTNQVVRTDPRPATASFEPNCFPSIDSTGPIFHGCSLRPVPTRTGSSGPGSASVVQSNRVSPWSVPRIRRCQHCESAHPRVRLRLPDLNECWAWAHAQVAADVAGQTRISAALNGRPGAVALAAGVSTYSRREYGLRGVCGSDIRPGRRTGLGLDIQDADLTSATALARRGRSHHRRRRKWSCRSTITGSFALVRLGFRIAGASSDAWRPTRDRPTRDRRSRTGFPASGATTQDMEGALLPIPLAGLAPPTSVASPGLPQQFRTTLANIINEPSRAQAANPNADPLLLHHPSMAVCRTRRRRADRDGLADRSTSIRVGVAPRWAHASCRSTRKR